MFGKKDTVKKQKRFVVKEEQNLGFGALYIIVDTVTGVHYVSTVGTGPVGITPLLDEFGQVVVDKNFEAK